MDIDTARTTISDIGRKLHARGWVPATSGNFSIRLADGDIAITASGKDKGDLSPDDVMRIGADGRPKEPHKPSAETLLHTQLYARDAEIGAVLHTHSAGATFASTQSPGGLRFDNLEILKAFEGVDTHETFIEIPVFANRQDIAALAASVDAHMAERGQGVGYLIAGHGVYTWGRRMTDCLRHLEALEYLFEYQRLGVE